ncbi:MAG: hypothetical protein ACLFTE_05565, partial [Salinivenus sp.]
MTDRDRHLQDAFDRHLRGDGPPPDTDDPEAAAYHHVYAVLGEAPEGDLPEEFAEQVADRVGLAPAPAIPWIEIVLLFLVVAGLGTGLVMLPSLAGPLQESLQVGLRAVHRLSTGLRLDVLGAVVLVLVLTGVV